MNFPPHLGVTDVGYQTLIMVYSQTNNILENISTVAGTKGTGGGFLLQSDQDQDGNFPCGYTGYSSYSNYYRYYNASDDTYTYGEENVQKVWNESTCSYDNIYTRTPDVNFAVAGSGWSVDPDNPQEGFDSFPGTDNRACRNTSGGTASGLLNVRSIWADEYVYQGDESTSAVVGLTPVEIDITNSLDPVAVTVQPDSSWHVFRREVRDVVHNAASSVYPSGGQTTNDITTGNQEPVTTPVWGYHGSYATLADAQADEPYEKTTLMVEQSDFFYFGQSYLADVGSYGANVKLVNHVGGRWRVTVDYSLFIYDLYTYQEIQTVSETSEVVIDDVGGFVATASFTTAIPTTQHGFYQTVDVVKYEVEQLVDDVLTFVEVPAPSCDGILIGMQRTKFAQKGLDAQYNSQSFYNSVRTVPKTAPRCGGGVDHDNVTTTNSVTNSFDTYGNADFSTTSSTTILTDAQEFVYPLETTDEYLKYESGETISIANANHTLEQYTYQKTGYSYLGLSFNDV